MILQLNCRSAASLPDGKSRSNTLLRKILLRKAGPSETEFGSDKKKTLEKDSGGR